ARAAPGPRRAPAPARLPRPPPPGARPRARRRAARPARPRAPRARPRARPPRAPAAASSLAPAESRSPSACWAAASCWRASGCGCACAGRLADPPARGVRESAGPAATEALGAELAAGLAPGDVVLVSGELGTGKTTFVRGASRALGVAGPVTSPIFTIGRRYAGR